jgi:hypothetical protein
MARRDLPPLPGVDPAEAPSPDDPGYCDWVDRVAFSPEGVDRELTWEQLHRSPAERLCSLDDFVATVPRIRGGRRPEIL